LGDGLFLAFGAPQYRHRSAPSSTHVLDRFFFGFATCLAIGLTAHFVHDRRQRAAFIASLSPAQREKLKGFETVKGDWHAFRDLLHH
jgi:hypothetical protein